MTRDQGKRALASKRKKEKKKHLCRKSRKRIDPDPQVDFLDPRNLLDRLRARSGKKLKSDERKTEIAVHSVNIIPIVRQDGSRRSAEQAESTRGYTGWSQTHTRRSTVRYRRNSGSRV